MRAALAKVKARFGESYPLVIGGAKIETEKKIRSLNPAHPAEVVGVISSASKAQALEAIEAATAAFERWKRVPMPERAQYLFKAAALLRERRFEYDALLTLEVGKSWPEADGDTAEAIDFLEFYAREALRYSEPHPVVPMDGERNEMIYIPLGVGAVIPPWNFAGAIMIGMTAASIITGNTVVLKPSSDSAVIAAWFVDLLAETGLPAGVVNFVPGSGAEIGDFRSSRIRNFGRSRSPDPKKSGFISTNSPPRRRRVRSGSSASSPRWAVKIRSSWRPTRTSMPRSKASRSRRSASRGKSARRARERSSTRRSTTSSSRS